MHVLTAQQHVKILSKDRTGIMCVLAVMSVLVVRNRQSIIQAYVVQVQDVDMPHLHHVKERAVIIALMESVRVRMQVLE
jgi:hypothetical protein